MVVRRIQTHALIALFLSSPLDAMCLERPPQDEILKVDSLGELHCEPEVELVIDLRTGDELRGKCTRLEVSAIFLETTDALRIVQEHEIFQVHQTKKRSRKRGALYGALIGAGVALGAELFGLKESDISPGALFSLIGIASIPAGAAIGALVSGEERTRLSSGFR